MQLFVSVNPIFRQPGKFHALHPFAGGTDQVRVTVTVKQGEALPPGGCVRAQPFGMEGVIFKDIIEEGEQIVKSAEEFEAVFLRDRAQVIGDPTSGLHFPFAGKTEDAVIGGDVGEKWKGAAADGTVVPLALIRTQAGKKKHTFRQF